MILSQQSINCLREIINEKTMYRSGPTLVNLFNSLGFNDSYGNGFPSRWIYTENKLKEINGTPELDKCIKLIFAPNNFIGRYNVLRDCLNEFNEYIAFDGWKLEIKNRDIEIHHVNGPNIEKIISSANNSEYNIKDFLKVEIEDIDVEMLPIQDALKPIIKNRINEVKSCYSAKAYLSVIFLTGSILEGVLLGVAVNRIKDFNQSNSSPKDKDGKIKKIHDWKLKDLIDVASSIGLLKEDVRKFSHTLRDFRNYIHPYQQLSTQFYPDENTSKICIQVLKAALYQLTRKG